MPKMQITDTINTLAYLNRANLVGVVEGQVEVWHDVLADLQVADVTEAAKKLTRDRTSRERWVTPGDIVRIVRDIVGDRTMYIEADLQRLSPSLEEFAAMPISDAVTKWRRIAFSAVRDGATVEEAAEQANQLLRRNIAEIEAGWQRAQIEGGRSS